MTVNFVSAAELMSRALGADDYPFAVIDHPVSSATSAELLARAEATVAAITRITGIEAS